MENLPKGAATLLVKELLILCERVATSLVKRYSKFTQGCGHPSGKGNVNFMGESGCLSCGEVWQIYPRLWLPL
jgi:hypothetical protein